MELRQAVDQFWLQVYPSPEARAVRLLLKYLTEDQRQTFLQYGWFDVRGGELRTPYRIYDCWPLIVHNVCMRGVRYGDAGDGPQDYLCRSAFVVSAKIGLVEHLPAGDQLLAQKLIIELHEMWFLKNACVTRVTEHRLLAAVQQIRAWRR